jgi:HSP20 family molecular chaperone IbpA
MQTIWRDLVREVSTRSRDLYEFLSPAVDMYEDGNELVVAMDLPGFDKKKIKMRLTQDTLTVTASREKEEYDGISYWEQRPLRVHRTIRLPVKVETEEENLVATAKYEDGVLIVRLPIKGMGKVNLT